MTKTKLMNEIKWFLISNGANNATTMIRELNNDLSENIQRDIFQEALEQLIQDSFIVFEDNLFRYKGRSV